MQSVLLRIISFPSIGRHVQQQHNRHLRRHSNFLWNLLNLGCGGGEGGQYFVTLQQSHLILIQKDFWSSFHIIIISFLSLDKETDLKMRQCSGTSNVEHKPVEPQFDSDFNHSVICFRNLGSALTRREDSALVKFLPQVAMVTKGKTSHSSKWCEVYSCSLAWGRA